MIKPMEPTPERIKMLESMDPTKINKKEFKSWITWWKTHFTAEDYLKFLSSQVLFFFFL